MTERDKKYAAEGPNPLPSIASLMFEDAPPDPRMVAWMGSILDRGIAHARSTTGPAELMLIVAAGQPHGVAYARSDFFAAVTVALDKLGVVVTSHRLVLASLVPRVPDGAPPWPSWYVALEQRAVEGSRAYRELDAAKSERFRRLLPIIAYVQAPAAWGPR